MEEEEGGGGGMVMVMSEEQIEQLRKQIAAFAVICDRLTHMHASLTISNSNSNSNSISHHQSQFLHPYLHESDRSGTGTDHTVLASSSKTTSSNRQRWSPTALQLQILERIYAEGNGTPGKQRIREITAQLTPYGPVSDTNVYNWFQNRRARAKRKQHLPPSSSAPPPHNAKPNSLLGAQVSSSLLDPAPARRHTGSNFDRSEASKSYYNPYDLLEQIKWIKDDAFH